MCFFFFQAEDGIRDYKVTGVQTCALPIFQALQALVGGVRTKVTALSQSGAVAGVSLNADNTALPVMWRNNETTARTLPAGLLGLVATNCVPADVDDHSVNPTMPNIVGNCPGSSGRPQPVLWSPGLLGTYASAALPLPAEALHCRASQVDRKSTRLNSSHLVI